MSKMCTSWCFLLCLVLWSCEANSELVDDLTWPIDSETSFWPTTQPFNFTKKIEATNEYGWYALYEFCSGEHVGTHFDAPYHFNKDGWKVGDVPLSHLFAKAVFIDVEHKQEKEGALAKLLPEDIDEWEGRNGQIKNGSVVFVKFGWSKHYGTFKYLHGTDKEELIFPGLSEGAAKKLAERKVFGVGVDTPSVDVGDSESMATHRVLAKNFIYNLENVKLTRSFSETGLCTIVLPMKIREGTGAAVRIVITTCDDQK